MSIKQITLKDKYGSYLLLKHLNETSPSVSIIMSAYNTDKNFLTRSIDSVLEQTFENFEFIIINDGADEETTTILNKYLNLDNRIKLVNQDNMGITKSLNRGIMLSTANYIARQDTDDIWMQNKLKKQLELIEANPTLSLIGTRFDVQNDNLDVITNNFQEQIEKQSIENTEDIRNSLVKYNPFCHASVLIKKEVLDKVGLYDDQFIYAQDYDLWVRILKDYNAIIIPEVLTKKSFLSNSITSKKRRKQRMLAMKAKMKAISYFGAPIHYKIRMLFRYIAVNIIPENLIQMLKK